MQQSENIATNYYCFIFYPETLFYIITRNGLLLRSLQSCMVRVKNGNVGDCNQPCNFLSSQKVMYIEFEYFFVLIFEIK